MPPQGSYRLSGRGLVAEFWGAVRERSRVTWLSIGLTLRRISLCVTIGWKRRRPAGYANDTGALITTEARYGITTDTPLIVSL